MTSQERIQAVFSGNIPDRVPWVPLIGRYYVNSLPSMGYDLETFAPISKATGPALQKDLNLAEIEAIRLTGADILYRHVMAYKLISDGCSYFEQRGERGIRRGWETPLGPISETVEYHHGTEYISSYMIKTPEDLRRYTYLTASMHPEAAYGDLKEFSDYIAEDGLATMTGPVTPIQQLLQFSMGVEKTTFAIFDHPDEITEFFTAQQKLNRAVYTILSEAPGEVVITYEDTSTTVLSPQWYGAYEAPHLNEYADILSAAGTIPVAHMCGKISLLTDQLAQDRYAAIDSLCPPTTGDIEPGDALRQTGKIIIGGLEPSALVRMTEDQSYAYAVEKLEQVREAGAFDRFMLSSGDSVAAMTPLENLQAVTRAVREYTGLERE